MAKILVCYYSRTKHTQHMAEAIADGARKVAGVTEVDVKPVTRMQARELLDYQGIILGSPTYYGTMASELKKIIDDSVAFHGQLDGRVGGAFASSANIAGGNETTILDIINALLIHGMVVRGIFTGDHYGPVAIGDVDDRARTNCQDYGKAVAELAVKLHG